MVKNLPAHRDSGPTPVLLTGAKLANANSRGPWPRFQRVCLAEKGGASTAAWGHLELELTFDLSSSVLRRCAGEWSENANHEKVRGLEGVGSSPPAQNSAQQILVEGHDPVRLMEQ